MAYCLGKKPPRVDPRTLRLAKYLTPTLPAPPPSSTLYTKVPPTGWPMDGNDSIGDCTVAGAAHLIEQWTAQTLPSPVLIPLATVEQDYFELTGGPDTGLDLLTVLNWWRQTGFTGAGGRITAYAQTALQNRVELEQAILLFGGAYLGLELPDFALQPPDGNLLTVPWVLPSGQVPPGNARQGGHCVAAVGYDAQNVYVVTWGAVKSMSWGFYNAYADEAFAALSPDWIGPAGSSPPGLDLAQLQRDLIELPPAP